MSEHGVSQQTQFGCSMVKGTLDLPIQFYSILANFMYIRDVLLTGLMMDWNGCMLVYLSYTTLSSSTIHCDRIYTPAT